MLRTTVTLLATAALLALAGSASADSELHGENWMRGKNTEARAVLIGKDVYQVAAHTQFLGLKEEQLELADLIWVPELESLSKIPRVPTLWVEYDATQVGDQRILNWVRLSTNQEGMDQTRIEGVDRYGRINQ